MKATLGSTPYELLRALEALSVTDADIISMYYDGTNGKHVAWHLDVADLTSPIIRHTQIPNNKPAGSSIMVTAAVLPSTTSAVPIFYYRKVGDPAYVSVQMDTLGAGTSSYGATIPGSQVTVAGVEYYIEATDGTNLASLGTAGVPRTFTVV